MISFRPRKRFRHRPSLNPEPTPAQHKCCESAAAKVLDSAVDQRESRVQMKQQSKAINTEEETNTDWTPEIPFRNVDK